MKKYQLEFKNKKFGSDYYKNETLHGKEIFESFKKLCENENPKSVLDLGCGQGKYSKLFPQSKYVGIDVADEIINYAKSKGLNVIKSDLEERLPFDDETFDMVISIDTLEHLYNTLNHLKEIQRVLTKDGFLVFMTPNISSLAARLNVLIGKRPFEVDAYRLGDVGQDHISAFGIDDLKEMFALAGLHLEVMSGFNAGKFTKKYLQWFVDRGFLVSLSSSFLIKARKISS